MNQETINKYKEIIANAPESATHWSADTYLQVAGGKCSIYNGLNVWSVPVSNSLEVFLYNNPIQLSLMVDIVELWESNQWINVGDRLPEKSGNYLACDGEDVAELFLHKPHHLWLEPNSRDDPITDITHWKPMPNPPKE